MVLESGIHFGMESGIQKVGIRNPDAGIRNLEAGIRNPGPSWILLHGAKFCLSSPDVSKNKGVAEMAPLKWYGGHLLGRNVAIYLWEMKSVFMQKGFVLSAQQHGRREKCPSHPQLLARPNAPAAILFSIENAYVLSKPFPRTSLGSNPGHSGGRRG